MEFRFFIPSVRHSRKRSESDRRDGLIQDHLRLLYRNLASFPTCYILEIAKLGRSLRAWKAAIPAYFDTSAHRTCPPKRFNGRHRNHPAHRPRTEIETWRLTAPSGVGAYASVSAAAGFRSGRSPPEVGAVKAYRPSMLM